MVVSVGYFGTNGTITIQIDGVQVARTTLIVPGNTCASVSAIVPAGNRYIVATTGSMSFEYWSELS